MYIRFKKIFFVGAVFVASCLMTTTVLAEETGLPNPLGTSETASDPRLLIGNVIRGGLGLVGSLALAVFMYGGFLWVTSGGNEEKITQGKNMILWAALGIGVIFFSYAMIQFVLGAITGGANATNNTVQTGSTSGTP